MHDVPTIIAQNKDIRGHAAFRSLPRIIAMYDRALGLRRRHHPSAVDQCQRGAVLVSEQQHCALIRPGSAKRGSSTSRPYCAVSGETIKVCSRILDDKTSTFQHDHK